MTTQRPECYLCRHLFGDKVPAGVRVYPRCAAYPDGIPAGIFFDGEPHRERRGDEEGGLVFSPQGEDAAKESGTPLQQKSKSEGHRFRRLPVI